MEIKISGITVECQKGDIARQEDMDAIVNAANAELRIGGGVAGAIHRAAGPDLERESVKLGPIKPGEAVITSAYKLPNRYVIHCLGPVYGHDRPEDKLLAACYANALALADAKSISSVACPAISTGAFGYPLNEAAEIAFKAVLRKVPELQQLKKIRFVLHSESDLRVYENLLREIARSSGKFPDGKL